MGYSNFLTHSCYIQTKASSQNYLGEWEYIWTSATTTTKCRMSPISAAERKDYPGRFDDVTFRGFFEPDSGVTVDNRIVYDSNTYLVREMILDSKEHHISTLLARL